MRHTAACIVFLLSIPFSSLLPPATAADKTTHLRFNQDDWEISCDNTRTCRAAGYQAENVQPNASVLLTRLAGPHQPVTVALQLAPDEDDSPAPPSLHMTIGQRDLGTVKIRPGTRFGTLSSKQTSALLHALMKRDAITWSAGKVQWGLSMMGAEAVLFKMDEFQGRLNTPGALIRQGTKPENTVLPPLPKPILYSPHIAKRLAQPTLSPDQRSNLIDELRASVTRETCEDLSTESTEEPALDLAPLTDKLMLVATKCWRAVFSVGRGYWIANRRAPYAPRFMTANGDTYEDGVIVSNREGTGTGDCVNIETWTWNGKTFVDTSAQSSGLCRDFVRGGPWELPTLLTDVRRTR